MGVLGDLGEKEEGVWIGCECGYENGDGSFWGSADKVDKKMVFEKYHCRLATEVKSINNNKNLLAYFSVKGKSSQL